MAKFDIIFAREAENDLEEILHWCGTINDNLCKDFISEIDSHYQNLQNYPHMFSNDFIFAKKIILRKFPYKICFVIDDARFKIIIIGILHQK